MAKIGGIDSVSGEKLHAFEIIWPANGGGSGTVMHLSPYLLHMLSDYISLQLR